MKLEALQRPVTKENVADFLQRHAARKKGDLSKRVITILMTVAFVVMVTLIFFADSFTSIVTGIIILTVITAVFIIVQIEKFQDKQNATIGSKLESMAKDNGWSYRYFATDMGYAGSLFNRGHTHRYDNIVSSPDFDAGKYTYTTGSGKNQQTYHYGFIALRLQKSMPHMLLDTKSNNTKFFGHDMSNLPLVFSKDQKVSLEGDFDKYYNLYAPKEYGVDVRYIFTPELMELLIQESSDDMEIIDDKLYVYMNKYNLENEDFWKKVERFRDVLGIKLAEKSGRYDDDRTVDHHTIAPEGRRLKAGVSWITIILIVVYLLSFLLEMMGDLSK